MRNIFRLTCLIVSITMASCHSRPANPYYKGAIDTLHSVAAIREGIHVQDIELPSRFGFGTRASQKEIDILDIDIRPDGKGLPSGKGNVQTGRAVYISKCISCHGVDGKGGSASRLTGAMGDTSVKAKTIGNYWPYSTTLFDYLRRAMPYNAPGTLTNNEVYSVTAYLLSINKVIDSTTTLNAQNLPKVIMPAQKYFVDDDRTGGREIR